PRHRRLATAALIAYLTVYLLAIGNIVYSPSATLGREIPSIYVLERWASKMWKPIAPFYYEAIAAIYLPNLVIFISVPNLLMGLTLGALLGVNVALVAYGLRTAPACGRTGLSGLVGALPGLLTGFACCVPTLALVLGANFALAAIAIRGVFFPASVTMLAASVFWTAHRIGRTLAAAPGP
ncbi:MAG: hypothetical protein HY660_10215, partial [Armatimonadetes bacterium]|nr:hypothetical protein [Armatimonadota bacterium]